MSDEQSYWFPAKRYGWGWGLPTCWQGWTVLLVWVAIVLTMSPYFAARDVVSFGVFLTAMIAVLLIICYAKGEPPRWRWGGD